MDGDGNPEILKGGPAPGDIHRPTRTTTPYKFLAASKAGDADGGFFSGIITYKMTPPPPGNTPFLRR